MKRLAIEMGICAVFALTAVVAVRCSSSKVKQAEFEASEAAKDAKDAQDALAHAESEKRELEAILAKYDDVLKKVQDETDRITKEFVERNEQICADDSGWLDEPVPDSVRDAFAEFVCGDTIDTASVGASDVL